jgi:hypothetical protein
MFLQDEDRGCCMIDNMVTPMFNIAVNYKYNRQEAQTVVGLLSFLSAGLIALAAQIIFARQICFLIRVVLE